MKLKDRKPDRFFDNLEFGKKLISKTILNKHSIKFYKISFLAIILFIGIIIGLIFSGYFGTFDQPSEKAYSVLSGLGLNNLHEMKNSFEGIVRQNIKIPFNFIRGKFSKPEKLLIDIKFKDLNKIEYKRQQAIDLGTLISSSEDYVSAKITHKGETYDVKLRLKGDLPDHWSGDKWSFRVKLKDQRTIMGMSVFSLQDPSTRQDLKELIYQRALQMEEVIGLRYQFVEVILNGENKGIYALEEHFTKELIENNGRREGVILKFNEDASFENSARDEKGVVLLNEEFYSSPVDTFEKDLENPFKLEQLEKGTFLLDSFRKGTLNPSETFDVDKTAKHLAITTTMNCPHSIAWHNMRFYYNPITSKLEPIGFDGNCRGEGGEIALIDFLPECIFSNKNYGSCEPAQDTFQKKILSDELIYLKYMKFLEEFSDEKYINNLFETLKPEINANLDYLRKDKPLYYFSEEGYLKSGARISSTINPVRSLNAYLENIDSNYISLRIGNGGKFPVEITSATIDEFLFKPANNKLLQPSGENSLPDYKFINFIIPENFNTNYDLDGLKVNYKIAGTTIEKNSTVFLWKYPDINPKKDFIRQKSNLENFEMLQVDKTNKQILISPGKWTLNESLIVPRGYTLISKGKTEIDLQNSSMILSFSNVNFVGEDLIKITSSDGSGEGITLIESEGISMFQNVEFSNLKSPSKEGWKPMGAINIFDSEIIFKDSKIINSNSEDSLNIISSKFTIEDVTFENCYSDCFDSDFSEGKVIDSSFYNCGNDCLDFSGSESEIFNLKIHGAGDKGLSAGEKSNIYVDNFKISGKVYVGIASKDLSIISLNNGEIIGTVFGLTAYQKKPEYGPSSISMIDTSIKHSQNDFLIENKSKLLIDNLKFNNNGENVHETLYPE